MSSIPSADELLDAIGKLLENEIMPAVSDELRHKVRVAANLIQILAREWQLGPGQLAAEHAALSALLGGQEDADVTELERQLDDRLRTGGPAGAPFELASWQALVRIARSELAIVKPGHDGWERD